MNPMQRTPAEVAGALKSWLADLPADWPPADAATHAFCRQRLAQVADAAVLGAKLAGDLGERPWRPLGHVLAVISENDHLGVVAALVAAALTGNRLTLKSRSGLAVLQRLRDALGWDASMCRIDDWTSSTQDDAQLLGGVDGVLVAGGEALIRHYRQAAAPGVRLIEYGPQISAAQVLAWPASPAEQSLCIEALVRDTTLFLQNVCSSPQVIIVPDEEVADSLFAALSERLEVSPDWPVLPDEVRLQQSVETQELRLRARLGEPIAVAMAAKSGWAVTRTPLAVIDHLPRGFRLVVADATSVAAALPSLQTLGVWLPPRADGASSGLLPALHVCRLGCMHERSLSAPHDGHWELAQWVRFVSCDLP